MMLKKILPNDIIVADENFNKLKGALEEYHRLVQEGILIPRGNNVQACSYERNSARSKSLRIKNSACVSSFFFAFSKSSFILSR